MVIVSTMLKIIVALALGFAFSKMKIMNGQANSAISKLIINAASPCLIFNSVVSMGSERKGEAVFLILIGVAIYVFLALTSVGATLLLRVPKGTFSTYVCILLFGNVGFLGLPIAQSLYGELGLFYMGILNIHFTLFAFTLGMKFMTSGSDSDKKQKFQIRNLVNPGTVGAVLAIILYMAEVKVPAVILAPISFIGQLTSPLAMIVLGSSIATYSLKKMFGNWRYYVVAALRLLIVPAIAYLILNAIWGTSEMTTLITIYIGCPSATILVMMSLAYGGDVDTASNCIGLMTICSIITIPMLWFFIKAVAGV